MHSCITKQYLLSHQMQRKMIVASLTGLSTFSLHCARIMGSILRRSMGGMRSSQFNDLYRPVSALLHLRAFRWKRLQFPRHNPTLPLILVLLTSARRRPVSISTHMIVCTVSDVCATANVSKEAGPSSHKPSTSSGRSCRSSGVHA